MNLKSKLVMGSLAALPVFALGGGLAYASPPSSPPAVTVPAPTSSTAVSAVDGPDTGGAGVEAKEAPEADGPGGHQDPAGNANHQFNGQE